MPARSPSGRAGDVAAVLQPVARAAGLVLEDVTLSAAGKRSVLRVVVDLPEDRTGGVPLDQVAEFSRPVDDALEAAGVMGAGPYVLEVTSPGADRPLTERRHWSRARGRLVTAPVGGAAVTGRVQVVDEDGVTLAVDDQLHHVAWADLGTGRVELEFNRPPGEDS